MKKLFNLFAIAAIAVFTLAGCSKNDQNAPASDSETVHITVKANVQDLSGEPGTKTYIDDNKTIIWGTGEYMKIAVQGSSATVFANSSDDSADAFDGEPQATFEFSLTAPEGDSYKYMGLYPASAAVANNNTNPANYKVNLISTQNATASSYDPAAYIMVAQPEVKESTITEWMANYRRATALNKITLKNLSEDIKRVKITVPTDVYLAGARHIDLTTGESGDIYNGGGRTNTVEIKYATPLAGGADMTIWFTSWDAEIPVGEKLTIVAYSNTHTFTREITVANKPITFKEGFLNLLSINMASAVEGDNDELEDGNYVILAKNSSNKYYALKAEQTTGTNPHIVSVEYSESISSYSGDADIIWSVAKSGSSYTISNGTNYLGYTGSGNGNTADLKALEDYDGENQYLMSIDKNDNTYKVSVAATSTRILAKNTSEDYFAFYTGSGLTNIVFVPATVDNRTPVTLSFENGTISKTTANYSEFTGQALAVSPNVSAITSNISYTMTGDAIGTISNGVVTLNGTTGTATITASFEGNDDYRPAVASYMIIVSSASEIGWIETALSDLTSSDVFVIVGNNGNNYAMPNDNTNSSPSAVSVTVSGTKLIGDINNNLKWTISGDATNGYIFHPFDSPSTWLYCNNSNTGVRIGSGENETFKIENGYLYNTKTSVRRYLGIYNSQDWRCYDNTTGNIANQTFKFYKYNDPRTDVILSFANSEISVTTEDYSSFSGQLVTASPNVSAITNNLVYSISGAEIGTIDSSTGNVTLNGETGSATVTVNFEGDTEYKKASASYTITVASVGAKKYILTISTEDFNSSSYNANNSTKTTEVTSTDNSSTIDISWTSYQVMLQSGYMQWQKKKGYIYNNTDLGTIISVTVNNTEGSFTTYYGTTENPSGTDNNGGYFKVAVGDATGKTTSIVIIFEK